MPSPSTTLATLRPDLGGSLMEYDLAMGRAGYVGQKVFRPFRVGKKSGAFGRVPIEQLLITMPTTRAPGSGYNRSKWTFEPDSYICQEHGHEEILDDDEVEMYMDYFDAELISVERARNIVLQNAEVRAASIIQDTGTFHSSGITDEWDDATNAIPITNVQTAVDLLWAKGIIANALIITRTQFIALTNCDQIIERIQAAGAGDRTMPGDITAQKLADLFKLKYVLVANAPQNTADYGLAADISGIWSDEYAAVTRIAETDDIREPCVGRTFYWPGGGADIAGIVEQYREESVRGEIYRVRHDVQEKVLYTEAVELLSNAITI